jgi:hypothetical protein
MAMVANVSVLMPSYEWLIYGRHLQQAESELPRIPIPRTPVNKDRKKREKAEAARASAFSAVAATL